MDYDVYHIGDLIAKAISEINNEDVDDETDQVAGEDQDPKINNFEELLENYNAVNEIVTEKV